MEKFKNGWRRMPTVIRKPLVLIIGVCIVIVGIILLPLPGPGWAIIFLGFALLATEFASAGKVRDFLVRVLKAIINWLLQFWNRIKKR